MARNAKLAAGPMGAAFFMGTSLQSGFVVLGVAFVGLAAVIWLALREPLGQSQ